MPTFHYPAMCSYIPSLLFSFCLIVYCAGIPSSQRCGLFGWTSCLEQVPVGWLYSQCSGANCWDEQQPDDKGWTFLPAAKRNRPLCRDNHDKSTDFSSDKLPGANFPSKVVSIDNVQGDGLIRKLRLTKIMIYRCSFLVQTAPGILASWQFSIFSLAKNVLVIPQQQQQEETDSAAQKEEEEE